MCAKEDLSVRGNVWFVSFKADILALGNLLLAPIERILPQTRLGMAMSRREVSSLLEGLLNSKFVHGMLKTKDYPSFNIIFAFVFACEDKDPDIGRTEG